MSLARGTGLYVRRDQFGFVKKCPHCTRTNIPKVHKAQITCGGEGCRLKRIGASKERLKGRKPRISPDISELFDHARAARLIEARQRAAESEV